MLKQTQQKHSVKKKLKSGGNQHCLSTVVKTKAQSSFWVNQHPFSSIFRRICSQNSNAILQATLNTLPLVVY